MGTFLTDTSMVSAGCLSVPTKPDLDHSPLRSLMRSGREKKTFSTGKRLAANRLGHIGHVGNYESSWNTR